MKPLELIVKYLSKYWQSSYGLRQESTDPQICGYEYCAEGAICDIFIKYAPEEAKLINAAWEVHDYHLGWRMLCCWHFCWDDTDGFGFPVRLREPRFMPSAVVKWINRHHGPGVGEKLQVALAYLNDGPSRYSLEQIADLIAVQFGLADVLGNAKRDGLRAFSNDLKQPVA